MYMAHVSDAASLYMADMCMGWYWYGMLASGMLLVCHRPCYWYGIGHATGVPSYQTCASMSRIVNLYRMRGVWHEADVEAGE
jgi:hypothetical protein